MADTKSRVNCVAHTMEGIDYTISAYATPLMNVGEGIECACNLLQ